MTHMIFYGGRGWHRKRDTLFQMLASLDSTTVMVASKKENRLDKTHKLVWHIWSKAAIQK